ncbi:MAG: hypothetical protein ABWZ53_01725 [Actinomycetota bacterium]
MRRTFMRASSGVAIAVVALATQAPVVFGAVARSGPIAAIAVSTGCDPSGSTPVPQPTQAELDAAGLGDIPLAPDSARRDLVAAPFSEPTAVTNPLFPIAELRSAILNGRVDGKPFYTETTLLPFTRIVEWAPGQCVRVLVSQYMAFLDGRLTETAIDLYAQADDGSVWYLGEDVFDYDPAGRVPTTEGTWHAGIEGPAAMIMPSDPQIGDANRPENIPGNVFEEVTVTKVDQTFEGPTGPISGGIVATETHQDGTPSDKLFAPGYGEFRSTDGPDVEAMALASPTDALPGAAPSELTAISDGADRIFMSRLSTSAQWRKAEMVAAGMVDSWNTFRSGDVPSRLVKPTGLTLRELIEQIASRDRTKTRAASIDASYASVDLQLRYRPVTEIDMVRFELWVRRALVHAIAGSLGGVRSDLVTIEWIRDRFASAIDGIARTRIDALVGDVGTAVVDEDLTAAAHAARSIRKVMVTLI